MQRFAAAALTLAFCLQTGVLQTGIASAADAKSTFSAAQKDEIRQMVREYLIEHPEVLNEAIDAMQAKETKAKDTKRNTVVAARKQEIFNPGEATIIGNAKGDVTVVEFFDYNCGYCKSMFQAIMETLKDDPKVRLVLKELPILGPSSVTASRAALAARKQGKYREMHLALLSHKGALSDESIMGAAKGAGLDVKKLEADMKDPEIQAIIAKNRNLADELGIDGTPALFIGGEFVPGAIQKDHLMELIADARKAARK